MRENTKRVVVATGGSRGLGRPILERFALAGDSVIAVAINSQHLDETVRGRTGNPGVGALQKNGCDSRVDGGDFVLQ